MELIAIWRLDLQCLLEECLPLEWQVLLDQVGQHEEGLPFFTLYLDLGVLVQRLRRLVISLQHEGFRLVLEALHELKVHEVVLLAVHDLNLRIISQSVEPFLRHILLIACVLLLMLQLILLGL